MYRTFTKIFLIMSVPWIFFNETRPIYSDDGQFNFSVNRTEAYFYLSLNFSSLR